MADMAPAPWSVNGKVVLVTGAARGIGAEASRRLAARGARVALLDIDGEALQAVAADCPGSAAFTADVTDVEALQAAVDAAAEQLGGIDAVVANAGIAAVGMVRSLDPAAFERTIEINVLGVWRTVRACLPYIIERRGYVLPVASLAAASHMPGMAAYCASKAAVEAFANALRSELAHLGVDVGCAYFSWIDTEMVRGSDRTAIGGKMRGKLKGPLARTYPVSVAAEAVVQGIEGRSRRVLTPGWIAGILALRGILQPLAEFQGRRQAPEADRIAEAENARLGVAEATRPVGDGGAAAMGGRRAG
jgi:NAD(P)-dependent dehydrogenase (short-subunit alcohol dehydrogenase family)